VSTVDDSIIVLGGGGGGGDPSTMTVAGSIKTIVTTMTKITKKGKDEEARVAVRGMITLKTAVAEAFDNQSNVTDEIVVEHHSREGSGCNPVMCIIIRTLRIFGQSENCGVKRPHCSCFVE
jgi:hypothetical protein